MLFGLSMLRISIASMLTTEQSGISPKVSDLKLKKKGKTTLSYNSSNQILLSNVHGKYLLSLSEKYSTKRMEIL